MKGLRGMSLVALCAAPLLASGTAAAEAPPRTLAGQTLEVPEAQLDLGLVYHVTPGEDTQLIAVSRAPLQRVALTASRVVGYFVAPFDLEDEDAIPVLAGAFRLPVADLRTGIDGGDGQLQSAAFLDRENHPEIGYEIQSVADLQRVSQTPEETIFQLTLRGTLTVKGAARELSIPAKLRFMPSSMRAMTRNVGDLAFLEGSFRLRPEDFGWKPPSPVLGERIADAVDCDLFLTLNTITPDKSGDPRDNPAIFAKQQRVLTFLRDLDDPEAGYGFARGLMDEIWNNGPELLRLAESIAFAEGVRSRRYDLALKAARRASELAEDREAPTLTTLARVAYRMGDLKAAAQWQRKAAALAPDDAGISAELARYEAELKR